MLEVFGDSILYRILATALPVLVSLSGVLWAYFKILKIAKEKQLVDNPDARKLQKIPVPVLGGIAVFFGVICSILTQACFMDICVLVPIIAAMVIMLYIGAMDDSLGLSALSRLFIEIVAIAMICVSSGMICDNFWGTLGVDDLELAFALPLTIIAGVGIINAMNMIDGVNGLSSGLCIICSLVFGIIFAWSSDMINATLAFSFAMALVPFLLHNVFGKTSKMFIGDAGTMVMGILLFWFILNMICSDSVVALTLNKKHVNPLALALAILSVPVFDTLRVMTARAAHGRSPFKPDKTHLHHMFIAVGVSHSFTALFEWTLGLLVVGAWSISYVARASATVQLIVVICAAAIFIWGAFLFLNRNIHNDSTTFHRLIKASARTHKGQTKWWLKLQKKLDAPEFKTQEQEKREEETLRRRHNNRFVHTVNKTNDQKVAVLNALSSADVITFDNLCSKVSDIQPNVVMQILTDLAEQGFIDGKTDENNVMILRRIIK